MGSGQIQRQTNNPVFITILGLKDRGGFKDRQEMSRCHESRFSLIIPPYFKDQIVARMRL